ncbi:hypothetical protein [Roseivivax sediminis]|uniref:Bile acid:Na+ symporter, BASS family n=1 Tax=Roseivivax sediminis TaxID=936889 RepID=A0A1I2D359_9RHOB|nr:hypothetical protein [Roseivivax sediminis]SFE74956.1 hypothetical protein SAMN04515678_11548 [Roseivivax sediminis]
MRPLAACARHGRWLLVAGLLAGIAVPGLADAMAPWIVPMLGAMLCLAVLREGPSALRPRGPEARTALVAALALQLALPLCLGGALWAAGLLAHPLAAALVLASAAAPITGLPGLAAMSGADVSVALRQVTLGTALLPLTALPAFALVPAFADLGAVSGGALRLLALIALAALTALLLRRIFPTLARPEARPAYDGAMALAMALVVVGLMSAIAPAAREAPGALAIAFVLACTLYAAQITGAWRVAKHAVPRHAALSLAIAAGNRNLALFLAALPPETAAPLMVFVGCYQVPMYLTPVLLPRLTCGRA